MDAMPLSELVERYRDLRNLSDKSLELYKMLLDRLERFLGHPPTVADLEDLTISRYLRDRATHQCRGKTISPASVQKDKVMIAAVWNLAARKRWVAEFPELPRLKVPKRLPVGRAYTAEDVAKLIRRARTRRGLTGGVPSAWWWSTLIYVAYCTAERKSALLGLRWGQVDLDRCEIVFLGDTRKGRTRDISRQITPDLAKIMRIKQGPPDALVWPWDRHSQSIYTSLHLLCETAGVKYRGFHGLRRTAASYAALAGGRAAATQLLDHADPNLQQVYVDPEICPAERVRLDSLPALDLTDRPPLDTHGQLPPDDRPKPR